MTKRLFLIAVFLIAFVAANENITKLSFKPKQHRRTHHSSVNGTKNIPDVDLNTIASAIIASVIPEAIHTITDTKTTNDTILTPAELIISQLSLPKSRASDMLCDVTWESKAKKKMLRCRDINLHNILFDDAECDSKTGDCTRYL